MKLLCRVISGALSFQFFLGLSLLAHPQILRAEESTHSFKVTVPVREKLDSLTESDLFLNQYKRTYLRGVTVDIQSARVDRTLIQEDSPLNRLDISNTGVPIVNALEQILPYYDAENKELLFHRVIRNIHNPNVVIITHTHVFKNIELLNPKIISDGNFFYFVSSHGMHALFKGIFSEAFCAAEVPAPVLYKLPPHTQLEDIEVLSYESTPRKLEAPFFRNNETILLTLKGPSGPSQEILTNEKLMKAYSIQAYRLLMYLHAVNPDLDQSLDYIRVLQEALPDFEAAQSKSAGLIFGSSEGTALSRNDLVSHALSNAPLRESILALSQQSKARALLIRLLKRDSGGSDAFAHKAQQPGEYVRTTPRSGEALSPWESTHATIQEGKAADANSKAKPRNWQTILLESLEKKKKEGALEEASAAKENAFLRFGKRAIDAFKRVATPKRLKKLAAVTAISLGLYLGSDIPDSDLATEGLGLLHTVFSFVQKIPVIGEIPAKLSISYQKLQQPGVFLPWLFGFIAVLGMYPATILLAHLITLRSAGKEALWNRFFNLFKKISGYLTYPLQMLLWENILRQKNLYPALLNDINPLGTLAAWNTPWATQESIDEKRHDLEQSIRDRASRNIKAAAIAAALVSKAHEFTVGAEAVDVATLVLGGLASPAQFEKIIGDASINPALFQRVVLETANLLEEIGDSQSLAAFRLPENEALNESLLDKWVKLYEETADRIQSCQGSGNYIANKLRVLATQSRETMSSFTLGALWGLSGYSEYQRSVLGPGFDEKVVNVAHFNYRNDFLFSASLGSLVDVSGTGDIIHLGDHSWRALVNGLQQNAQWGIMGPLGPHLLSLPKLLQNFSLPLPYEELRSALASHGRSQSTGEALAAVISASLDPKKKRFFDLHAATLGNAVAGIQLRLFIDLIPRYFGLYAKMEQDVRTHGGNLEGAQNPSLDGAPLNPAFVAIHALSTSVNYFLVKYCFLTGFGYAIVWPYLNLIFGHMEDAVKENEGLIQAAIYGLSLSEKTQDTELLQVSVSLLQRLYELGGVELEGSFSKEAASFSFEEASAFKEFALRNPPLATKKSGILANGLNLGVGALISTVFATLAGYEAFNLKHLNAGHTALITLASVAVSYQGLRFLGLLESDAVQGMAKIVKNRDARATKEGTLSQQKVLRREIKSLCESIANARPPISL